MASTQHPEANEPCENKAAAPSTTQKLPPLFKNLLNRKEFKPRSDHLTMATKAISSLTMK